MSIVVDCTHTYPSGFRLEAHFELTSRMAALFGPSGSGKTSIVSILAGVLRPAHGRIRFGDDLVWQDSSKRIWVRPERRGVGVVFQDHRLFPHRNVESNLRYGSRFAHRPTEHVALSIDRVVDVLELQDLLKRMPDSLSGGEQRRVAIGRALLRQPRLLLLDEPLTGLDEGLSRKIVRYIDRITHLLDVPTVLVSHQQALVRRFAEEIVVLENGRVIASGPTGETLDDATLRQMSRYPGPVNVVRFVDVKRVGDHAVGRIGDQSMYLPRSFLSSATDDQVYVEIDPTDIVLAHSPHDDLSTRSRLKGTISELVHLQERDCWFVAVDVGQRLWTEVTDETVRKLELVKGLEVHCLVKAMAMNPL